MHWLLAVAIAGIALILTPGISFYFDVTPKLLLLLAATAIAWTWPRRSPLWILTVLTAVSLAVSTALSANVPLSMFGTTWRRYGVVTQGAVLLFALAISTQAHRIGTILRAIAGAGALAAVYGIAQYFGFDPILPSAGYHIGEGIWTIVRPPSTFGYVSYFATWMLSVIFLSLAIPGRWWRGVAVLAGIAMLLTGTRAAILGAVVGAVVWVVFSGADDRFLSSARRAIARHRLLVMLAAIAALVFIASPAGLQLRSRFRWFVEDPWGGARPLLWRDSFRMALAHPLVGHGPEVFTATFPKYESPELGRAYPDFAHESAHNIFLDAFTAQGLPGLLLLVAFCTVGFRAAWRARAAHPQVAAALAAALAATIVAQQFTVFTIATATVFFATIALAVGLHRPPQPGASPGAPHTLPRVHLCPQRPPSRRHPTRPRSRRPDRHHGVGRPLVFPKRSSTPRKSPPTFAHESAPCSGPPMPPVAPPELPRIRSMPGTASPASWPPRTISPVRSKRCVRPSPHGQTGTNRTGRWPSCYFWNGVATKANRRPPRGRSRRGKAPEVTATFAQFHK